MAETRPPKEAKKADKTTPARARNGPKPPLIRYPADQPTGVFAVMNQANDAFHIGAGFRRNSLACEIAQHVMGGRLCFAAD